MIRTRKDLNLYQYLNKYWWCLWPGPSGFDLNKVKIHEAFGNIQGIYHFNWVSDCLWIIQSWRNVGGNKFLQMMPTLIQSDLIRPNKLTRYQLNSGVSDVNGRIRNIYARGTTLLGGQSETILISRSFLGWISVLKWKVRVCVSSASVCHSLGPGISLKNVIRSRTNYGYYLSMKVALIVLLILRLDGTTQNIDNQGPSCSPGFEGGTSFILITYLYYHYL